MNKLLSLCLLCLLAVVLLPWGSLGHQTIGPIAQRHLTPKAKIAVQYYLEGQTLERVSIRADEVRGTQTTGIPPPCIS